MSELVSTTDAGGAGRSVPPCLGVVMPCYNEAATLKVIVDRVLDSPLVRELVIVDDGSTDETLQTALGFTDPRVRVFAQPINLGKGAALRRGFHEVQSPYVIVQDADLEYDPADYTTMLAPLLSGDADVVYGSRFLSGEAHRVLYYWHSVGNRFLTTTSNMFTNLNLTDMETCYKAFRLDVIRSVEVEEDRFGFEPEITAKIARQGWRVYEVGISYNGRTYAEGKKIGWRDGVRAVYGVLRYSPAWSRVRERIDRAPDRNLPPAHFEDADAELSTVLESLEGAERYADWILSLAEPHLGEHVLEIGAGHGEMTQRLVRSHEVTATDLSPRCVEELRTKFAGDPRVHVELADAGSIDESTPYDSAILVNVLEHIEDDVDALRDIGSRLRPGGRIAIYVPAFEGLYSDFDRRVGHRRRYRRSHLAEVVDRAGLNVVEARYVNSLGAIAWWTFARQLGQVPTQQWSVRLFDRVVPTLSRVEAEHHPRFGQSLFCVAERPAH
jgi:2-polyprenyl-3-methyl-5-hydroxy-6-metoxy-1,4-benzoquinol methylase